MRIVALGEYWKQRHRVGLWWDSQARAFEAFGHQTMLVDIRQEEDWDALSDRVRAFGPDLLWIALKEGLAFLLHYCRRYPRTFRTLLWFVDLRSPEGQPGPWPVKTPIVDPAEVHGKLDFLFLSNAGQLDAYRKAYRPDLACYMPQCFGPEALRRVRVPEFYNIGFTGCCRADCRWHSDRARLIRRLSEAWPVEIRDDLYGDALAQFYGECRIVLGVDATDKIALYQSNRIWNATGCGAFYLTCYIPGLERLAENHRHLVWFHNTDEMIGLAAYYLDHDEEREQIRRNARAWALQKHAWEPRMQNAFQILRNEAPGFTGWLHGW